MRDETAGPADAGHNAGAGYNADDLQVLKGLDAVRKRPGMYIGSTDSRGLTHCLFELIDNAVDEALAGHCGRIEVRFHADGSVSVADDGRGIPVDVNRQTGLSGLELVFMELHAGGKFGGGGYAVSGGLHGVGASVVNALAARLDAEVDRDGKTFAISFSNAVPGVFDRDGTFTPAPGLRVVGRVPATKTGTRVRFWPDRSVFLADAAFDLDAITTRIRQTAFLVPGLEIVVVDERAGTETRETFRFDGGMADMVEFLAADRPLTDTIVLRGSGDYTESVPVLADGTMVISEVARTMRVEVALRWGTGYETEIRSFANIVHTAKGGTHLAGFERALVKVVNEALRSFKVLKVTEDSVVKDDVCEGLTAVVLVRIPEPQFEGQTKEILGTPAASGIVAGVVADGLRAWFDDRRNRPQARAALEKVATAARTRRALRLQKETIRRKNALESSALPAKLADCRSDDVERTELLIVEGDSAMGSARAARDAEFQALLPIRGKILNTLRASEKQMLDNAECAAIITAMGAGSGRSFDITQIRYGKLCILSDADVDGAHIRTLLLTLVYRYMRPLLEEGRVYACVPPLHRIELARPADYLYTYSDDELRQRLAELETAGRTIKEVQRYKGLGEMDADQLAQTTLAMDRRILRRITLADAETAAQAFELCMGANVGPRREFIAANALNVDRTSLDI